MAKLKRIASPLLFGFGMMIYIFLINYIPIAHTGIDVNAINESILIRFLIDIIGIGLPVAVIFLIAKKQNIPLVELGFTKKRLSLAFILLGIFVAVFIFDRNFTGLNFFTTFVSRLIFLSIGGAIIWRGYIFTQLNKKMGFILAAAIASLFFAIPFFFGVSIEARAIYFDLLAFIALFLLGIIFAFILKKSESIWITGFAQAIFLHMHFLIILHV